MIMYKQTDEDPEEFIEIIGNLVYKIFEDQVTKEILVEQMLIECSNEKELKKSYA